MLHALRRVFWLHLTAVARFRGALLAFLAVRAAVVAAPALPRRRTALPVPATAQVFRQRLEQEHGASVIVTAPTVPCRVVLPGGEELELQNPAEFPLNTKVAAGGRG